MKKVILAYSGGLDTTCAVQWLRDKGFEVICFSANLGSEFSPPDLKKRALSSGAKKIYVHDLRKEFAGEYILPALKANACYENKYFLATALGRPLIARRLVDIAAEEGASYIAHGCTGKGNDQVRFEVSISLLNPNLKIIAPLREWELRSREEELAYAARHRLPLKTTKEKLYSIDRNIWGLSVEAGALEDLSVPVPGNSYISMKPLKKVKDKEVYVEIEFDRGVPVKLNNRRTGLVALIEKLNEAGSLCGIGRTDVVEDRVVGIKSREIYEAPAAWILTTAHKEIESVTLDRETLLFKESVSLKYARLVYQGLWFSPLKSALDAFVDSTQVPVSGKIGLCLYKGTVSVVKRMAAESLYNKSLATYGAGDSFDPSHAEGFIRLWAMPYQRGNTGAAGKKKR